MNKKIIIVSVFIIVSFLIFSISGKVDYKIIFNNILKTSGSDIARDVEKIFRLETANFSSNIFNQTQGCGMLAFKTTYPYGWGNLKSFWDKLPSAKPVGVYKSSNGLSYLKFSNGGAFYTLAAFLINHRPEQWNSKDATEQNIYAAKLSNIKTQYT